MEEFINTFGSAINFAKENNMKGVLFVGDLNARSTLWGDSRNNKNGVTLEHYIENKLVKILNNGEKTFYSVNGSSVIDLCMTTDQLTNWKSTFYTDIDVELLTGYPSRGHVPVYAKFVLPGSYSTEKVTTFKLDDVNWKKWRDSLEDKLRDMSFPDNPIFKDPIAAWNYLKEAIKDVNRECIPTKSTTKHSKPFWNDQLTQLSNEVRSRGKTYKRTSTPQNHEALLKARARFKEELSTAASQWTLRKLQEVNQAKHGNEFWKSIKRVFPTNKDQIPSPLKSTSGLCFDSDQKERILLDTFFSGKHLKEENFDEDFKKAVNDKLKMIEFLEKTEDKELRNLSFNETISSRELNHVIETVSKMNCSPDDDHIHPKMISMSGPTFRTCLINLFNSCLSSASWPWNETRVLFLKKPLKPNYSEPSAYRPISISSHIGKLFERILNNRLKTFMLENNLIDQEQEGFMQNKNTTRSLFRLKIEFEVMKKSKLKAALINLDLEKAFDSVWHNGLLFKLWIAGIRGPLFKILQTFLKTRLVRTRLEGRLSLQVQPKQGVPQGSVLSPLLFIFYIAEMLTNTSGIKFKYADDSQILVSAPVESALHRILQRNLNIVEKWCRTWRIQINGSKTEIMHINSDGLTTPVFTLGNEACKIKSKTKILGLIVDNACSFKDHTELVVARCKNKWRELRIHCTSRWGLSRNTLTTLYKTLILPTLLYCAPVWSNQNAAKLQTFQAFVNRSILQTRFNPNESAAEVILGTPPIDIVCQNISAKFLTKVLQQRDLLSELFIKSEGTVTFVTIHRNILKTFYNKKNLDLTDPLSYNEAISRTHILRQWNSRWQYPHFLEM